MIVIKICQLNGFNCMIRKSANSSGRSYAIMGGRQRRQYKLEKYCTGRGHLVGQYRLKH